MENAWWWMFVPWQRKVFVLKPHFFAKNAIFSKIMSQSKDFIWLIQAPYISKHISRNGGATIKASRKTAHDKVVFILGQKSYFFSRNGDTTKKFYSPKYVYWYQCLMYERWLVLKVRYTASPMLSPFHRLTLLMHVSQKWPHITLQLLNEDVCPNVIFNNMFLVTLHK